MYLQLIGHYTVANLMCVRSFLMLIKSNRLRYYMATRLDYRRILLTNAKRHEI